MHQIKRYLRSSRGRQPKLGHLFPRCATTPSRESFRDRAFSLGGSAPEGSSPPCSGNIVGIAAAVACASGVIDVGRPRATCVSRQNQKDCAVEGLEVIARGHARAREKNEIIETNARLITAHVSGIRMTTSAPRSLCPTVGGCD